MLTVEKAAKNLSYQSTGSQTFNQQRVPTDHTDGILGMTNSPPDFDYATETKQLGPVC